MILARDKSPHLSGFAPSCPEDRDCLPAALALAVAFAVLPFVLLLPVDVDRTLPFLLVPTVWLGWKISRPAAPAARVLTLWLCTALLLSTAFAGYPARALATASATLWVIAGGMVARHLARSLPAVRLVLAGIALGAALGSLLVVCRAAAEGRAFPLYWSLRIYAMHQFAGVVAGLGWLALSPPGLRAKWPAFVLCAASCAGVAASGGRAPLLGLGAMIAAWFCRGGAADRRFLLRALPSLAAVTIAASALIGNPYANMGLWSALERTTAAENLGQLSSDRSDFWPEVWKRIWETPWLGHGSDAYLYIQPRLDGSQPHDLVLQFLYEHGLFGALPALLLLLLAMWPLLRRHAARAGVESPGLPAAEPQSAGRNAGAPSATPSTAEPSPLLWAAAATAGCIAYGIFDGIFYHQVVFIAAAVFTGLALGFAQGGRTPEASGPVKAFHPVFRSCLLFALSVLLLHGFLGLVLLRGRSFDPDSPQARLLRAFPSTTFGLRQWVARWERTQPEVALEWMEWAQLHSCEQPEFHLAAVQYYFNRRDFVSAERELRECLGKVSRIEVKEVQRLLDDVAPRARAQAAAAQAGNQP